MLSWEAARAEPSSAIVPLVGVGFSRHCLFPGGVSYRGGVCRCFWERARRRGGASHRTIAYNRLCMTAPQLSFSPRRLLPAGAALYLLFSGYLLLFMLVPSRVSYFAHRHYRPGRCGDKFAVAWSADKRDCSVSFLSFFSPELRGHERGVVGRGEPLFCRMPCACVGPRDAW